MQLLHGAGGHAGALEVDEGTESLMQHSDAFYLAVPTNAGQAGSKRGQARDDLS